MMMMMMMMLRRNTRDKLGCCLLPLKNLVAPFHSCIEGGGDWNEYARMVSDRMLESRPLPRRERLNKLLGRFQKYDLHPAVISLNRQMLLHGIARDEYNLLTLLQSYFHLKQFGFGLSVMVNYIKLGFQFDATVFDYIVHSFVEKKMMMEMFYQMVPEGHSASSYAAIYHLMRGFDEDFKDFRSVVEFLLKSRDQYCQHNNLQAQVTKSTPRPENTYPDAEPRFLQARVTKGTPRPENTDSDAEPNFLQSQYDMREDLGFGHLWRSMNNARVTKGTPRLVNTYSDAEPDFLQGQYDMLEDLDFECLNRLWCTRDYDIANKAQVTKGTPRPENTNSDAEPGFLHGQYDMHEDLAFGRLCRSMDDYIANKARVTEGTPQPENTDPDAEPDFLQVA